MDGVEGREFISTQGNCWHSVCASAREISASSVRVRSLGILRPFLRFSSAPRKHIPHFPFLPSIHSRRPTSISVWERVSLHNSHSFPPLFPIQQASGAHSLIQCNTLQCTVAFLTPTLLDLSTTSYPISAPHCFFSRMNKYYSVFSDAILLSDDI